VTGLHILRPAPFRAIRFLQRLEQLESNKHRDVRVREARATRAISARQIRFERTFGRTGRPLAYYVLIQQLEPTTYRQLKAGVVATKGETMDILKQEKGAIGWILLWALGIPIPLLILFFLVRGCT
jgi:hypothetical protein